VAVIGLRRQFLGSLAASIDPTKSRASLILEKGHDHRVTNVQLRRL